MSDWRLACLKHECGHAAAALLTGKCPVVIIALDGSDGMLTTGQWTSEPTDQDRLRVIIGGMLFRDGVDVSDDAADLEGYSMTDIAAASEWAALYVKPFVDQIDQVELQKMLAELRRDGALEIRKLIAATVH